MRIILLNIAKTVGRSLQRWAFSIVFTCNITNTTKLKDSYWNTDTCIQTLVSFVELRFRIRIPNFGATPRRKEDEMWARIILFNILLELRNYSAQLKDQTKSYSVPNFTLIAGWPSFDNTPSVTLVLSCIKVKNGYYTPWVVCVHDTSTSRN